MNKGKTPVNSEKTKWFIKSARKIILRTVNHNKQFLCFLS